MKNDKIYTSSDGRKFVARKKGNNLVAVSIEDKKISYGTINLETERCVGGTHCFEGLKEALKEFKANRKNPNKPKFFQAVLKPVNDIVKHVYPHAPQATIAERMGDENATCPECGKNHWILLPAESVAVREGGKPYMECINCGLQTHF